MSMTQKKTTRRMDEAREDLTDEAARADIAAALAILDRAGDEPPREGDEIPEQHPAP
jgi:hypothetical protein